MEACLSMSSGYGPKVNLTLLAVAVGLASLLLYFVAHHESSQARIAQVQQEAQIKQVLLAKLHTARQVEFRNLRGNCGEVRYIAFNGVHVGFKRFVLVSDNHAWIEQADSRAPFSIIWQDRCLR